MGNFSINYDDNYFPLVLDRKRYPIMQEAEEVAVTHLSLKPLELL